MINLHYLLALTFCCIAMDGNKFSLSIGLNPMFVHPSSQIDHHLDKLSTGEGRWIEFIRSISVMMGGVIVRYDRCARIFSWKGLGVG